VFYIYAAMKALKPCKNWNHRFSSLWFHQILGIKGKDLRPIVDSMPKV
jgi:hypothetical protein